MSYKINIKVSDFEEGNIVTNNKKLIWGKEWNLWTKRKIPRLSSLSTSEKGGNLAGQKLAQKRVATSTILRARHPWPVICSILSDTLPSPKSLHPSQPLLNLILQFFENSIVCCRKFRSSAFVYICNLNFISHVLSDALPPAKSLHPSQPLLHFGLHLVLDF